MNCLTDLEIMAFAAGDLPSATLQGAEEHLDACPLCFTALAAVCRTSKPEYRPRAEVVPGPLLADGTHRYVPGPEIARGGMGRILAGEDRLLDRPVALKLLRHSSASLARRFRREQRITARLQHPAIVPVHDAGVLDDGEPFFVMRLVKGQGLDRIADRAASLGERLQLLPAVLAVVDAVAYAHGEGVMHRDLKPQNVLVGPFGEVVVLDWGLARELGVSTECDADTGDVDSGDPDDRGVTRDGERLGTIAYMAPEQAAGHAVDARSDVYGLGAILYHVLSGRPPHAERTTSLSTAAVLHAPQPLILLAPDVPQDLAAIVARAMASEPAARYASAQELAADLKRWQAGRLVEAHRYSPGERLGRFMHRYRGHLLVGTVALVVLLAVGAVGLWQIFAERGRALDAQGVAEDARIVAEDARRRAETQRVAADTQRVAAEKLVAFILDDLHPRMERLGRLDLLADVARAVRAYQDSAPSVGDTETWLRRAQAVVLAGDVAFRNGDLGAAEESYRLSREAAIKAGDAEAPTVVRCRAARGLGQVNSRRADWASAASYFKECMALTRDATAPDLRVQYLRAQLNMGNQTTLQGDMAAAQTIYEEGLAAATAQVGAEDPHTDIFALAQDFRLNLLQALLGVGKVAATRELALTSVAFARARVAARPDDRRPSDTLAATLAMLCVGEAEGGDLAAAERSCEESLAVSRWLLAQEPSNPRWRTSLENATQALGEVLLTRGNAEAALRLTESLVESREHTASSSPDDLFAQVNLAEARLRKARFQSKLGRLGEARREYRRAIDILDPLTERVPGGDHASILGSALGLLGALELKAQKITVAQALLRRSIDVLKQQLAGHDRPLYGLQLAQSLTALAASERGLAAREHIEEAVALLKPLQGQPIGRSMKELNIEVERVRRAIHARRSG